MIYHVSQPCEPLPIVLTGDEEWVERIPGISLKEYRGWLENAGKVVVITLNPITKRFEIEERESLKEKEV